MLISIKRTYVGTMEIRDVMINTRYVVKIESTDPEVDYPKTRIVLDGLTRDDPISFIYTEESLASIKSKLSKARKTIQSEE
jgi:hypothetical protein